MADTIMAPRLSELTGVGHVSVQGGIRPAIRIQADFARLAAYGIGLEDLRIAIVGANVAGAKGSLDGAQQSYTIAANDQISSRRHLQDDHRRVPQRRAGAAQRRRRRRQRPGKYQGRRFLSGQAGDRDRRAAPARRQRRSRPCTRVRAELPRLRRAMPAGAKLTIVNDRTATIRASIHDVQFTLVLSVVLVVLVVLIFLRTVRATIIAGVALPLSLIATFGVMWFCRVLARQSFADGADHRHRLRRRRRHRHDREHRPPHGERREAAARRPCAAPAKSASP